MNYDAIRQILAAFERCGVRYVVFGGEALNFHGIARFTEDLDVFVAPTAENIEALQKALRSVYDDPEIDSITADDLLGQYPAIQYVPPEGDFHIDLLTRRGAAFHFEDLDAMRLDLDGVTTSVASPRTLYRLMRNTMRLRDRADAQLLKERFTLDEE